MPSVYEIVTEKIIKQLESGVAPWRKPWTCQTPANLLTQEEYRGLKVFTLASQGFPSRFWLTFNQATKLGGRIRKGEKSWPVIFWNIGDERETTTQDGTKETSRPFLLRYYSVFNLSQAEGIDIPGSLLREMRNNNPIETCEQIVTSMPNPPAFEQSDKAWYSPSNDVVGMPARGLFHSSKEYYATEFHELAHSTGHAKRLYRENFDNQVASREASAARAATSKRRNRTSENDPKSTCSVIIEERVYLNIMTKFCCMRSDFRVQNGGGFSGCTHTAERSNRSWTHY
jgi:antirestriction protein ArdC